MRTTQTTSTFLRENGIRLDASFHASQGIKTQRFINNWRKQSPNHHVNLLSEICLPDGLYIPSRFKRIYVEDPAKGAPYITGGSILKADPITGAKLLSYKFTQDMERLALHEKMILITCSGTIGNTLYVNEIFEGAVGSPDLIRILTNENQIPSGYLYTFLSSDYGHALIEQKTYGAVVPHIEAHHIKDLPIPRLEPSVELQIHNLIQAASQSKVYAKRLLEKSEEKIETEMGFDNPEHRFDHAYSVGIVNLEYDFSYRLDSFAYVGYVKDALEKLRKYKGGVVRAPDVGFSMFNPPIFKRMFAESGIPYMSAVNFYDGRPKTDRYLSKLQPDLDQYIVKNGTMIMQNAGQRYGLITKPLMVTERLDGVAITSDVIRVMHEDLVSLGYLHALFSSNFGRRLALRYSYGTSIPRLNVPDFTNVQIPWPTKKLRNEIGELVIRAYEHRDLANEKEDKAQSLLQNFVNV